MSCTFFAQSTGNIIGDKFTLPSKVLAQDREIQIYFPESYHDSNKDYPVLYQSSLKNGLVMHRKN